jgi:hypothetical protein
MQVDLMAPEEIAGKVKNALLSGQVPTIYANGFVVFLSISDVGLVLQANGREVCVLNMSYTMAKSIVEKLGASIRDFEEKTGNNIMTSEFIQQKMQQAVPAKDSGGTPNASSH